MESQRMGALERHRSVAGLSNGQQGVVSRPQLRRLGWTDGMVDSQLRSERWAWMLPGTYATFTGEPGMRAWLWAGYLYAGEDAVVAGISALQTRGVGPLRLPVEVGVAARRRVRDQEGLVVIRRHAWRRRERESGGFPPAVQADQALLDAIHQLKDPLEVADLVTRACQIGITSAERIDSELSRRSRHPHRRLLRALLDEIRDGATTILEVDGVRLVLRAHGLPTGEGQVREAQAGRVVLRDRVIAPFGLVIEFDGRLGHSDPRSRFRDHRRDNAVIASGRPVLRFGWVDVHQESCEAATLVAEVLIALGWMGFPRRCGPKCRLAMSQRAELSGNSPP